jgi:hypothetical protein
MGKVRQINGKELLKPLNPKSCLSNEDWVIYNVSEWRLLETQPTEKQACYFTKRLNQIEGNKYAYGYGPE